jgi:hypothetical protein
MAEERDDLSDLIPLPRRVAPRVSVMWEGRGANPDLFFSPHLRGYNLNHSFADGVDGDQLFFYPFLDYAEAVARIAVSTPNEAISQTFV